MFLATQRLLLAKQVDHRLPSSEASTADGQYLMQSKVEVVLSASLASDDVAAIVGLKSRLGWTYLVINYCPCNFAVSGVHNLASDTHRRMGLRVRLESYKTIHILSRNLRRIMSTIQPLTNVLKDSKSPYLLQHKDNPVAVSVSA